MVMIAEGDLINCQNAPLEHFDLSAMPLAEKLALKKKLKTELAAVRFAIKNIGTECKKKLVGGQCEESLARKYITIVEGKYTATVEEHMAFSGNGCSSENPLSSNSKKRKLPEISRQKRNTDNFYGSEVLVTQKSEAASTVSGASKGGAIRRLDDKKGKGQKMDINKTRHCATILKKLMTHKHGWVFNHPVDPVKLNIPDYFSIISRPMDLGTIKNKLERKLYSSTHQFAADVRLTFSNAMQYNPPGNAVHNMAKELDDIFSERWKALEVNWRKECSVSSQRSVAKKTQKQVVTSKEVVQKTSTFNSSSLPRKSLISAEKLKLRNYLTKLSLDNMPPNLLGFLQKACLLGQNEDILDLDIDVLDDNTLWELHQIVRNNLHARCTKSADDGRKFSHVSVQDLRKGGGGNMLRYRSFKDKFLTSPFVCKNGTCGNMDCCCNRHNDFTQSLSSDVDSERSTGRESYVQCSVSSSQECKNMTAGSWRGNLNSDLDVYAGAAIVIDGDNTQPSSHPSSPVVTSRIGEDHLLCEQQLSPSKALRAAILKSRFVDTILKAQHKTLLNHGEKGDPLRMQREREKLERKQQEEKARIEAQVKAAEAAARMKAEAELKMHREKEREAARLALQKMEQTVEIDENARVLKDLENLAFAQPDHNPDMHDETVVNFMDGLELQSGHVNPLEQLGLFMKNEDLDEEAEDWLPPAGPAGNRDVEEGEISNR